VGSIPTFGTEERPGSGRFGLDIAVSDQAGKYARFELETRFLLDHVPEAARQDQGWLINDRYVIGTRLRLRRMEPLGGGDAIFKLGQKDVPAPPDYSRVTITNIYLSPREHDVLAALPSHELRKRRYRLDHADRVYGIDVFEDRLVGLILAETSFATTDEWREHRLLPDFAVRDVSRDIRFTGGALAATTRQQVAELLS
jgi:CYTH domain-containing protein